MKYFIVADTLEAYSEYIVRNNFDGRYTFYCESRERAERDVEINQRQGIEAKVIVL